MNIDMENYLVDAEDCIALEDKAVFLTRHEINLNRRAMINYISHLDSFSDSEHQEAFQNEITDLKLLLSKIY